MKSTANYMDRYLWSSKFDETVVYLPRKLFMNLLFLKLHMFTGNYSVNINISSCSRVNFFQV